MTWRIDRNAVAVREARGSSISVTTSPVPGDPDKASQGTAGVGSTSHLAGIFFQMQTGTRYQFVPYRNTGMQDLMAGLIDLMIDPAANSVLQVRDTQCDRPRSSNFSGN